jgi:hypothetical protein
MNKKHIGSDLDSLLAEDGTLAECEAVAHQRVVAWQIEQEMKKRRISLARLAGRMETSVETLKPLFSGKDSSVSLHLLEKAALALGKKLRVELA